MLILFKYKQTVPSFIWTRALPTDHLTGEFFEFVGGRMDSITCPAHGLVDDTVGARVLVDHPADIGHGGDCEQAPNVLGADVIEPSADATTAT